jgi:UDP-glucose 4-epimerase
MSPINNVLITGATSFLGKILIKQLSNEFTTSNTFPILRKNSTSSDKLQGIDCFIHCAACVHVMNELDEDPLKAFRRGLMFVAHYI